EIIRAALSAPGAEFWLGVIALITAGLTAYYMFRLFFIAFGWEWLSRDERHLHEAPPIQTVPVIILATGGVVAGYIPVANFLSPIFGNPVEVNIAVVLTLAGLSVLVFVRPGFALARLLNDRIEPRVIDAAVNGVAEFFLVEAKEFRLIQTGRVRSYALWTLGGAIGVVLVVAAFLGYLPVRLG